MKNILLVEDRVKRQELFLSPIRRSFADFRNLTNINGGQEFADFKKSITNKRNSAISGFDIIIVHRSAFDNEELSFIKKTCIEHNISLVIFSGGITSSFYNNTSKTLLINVKTLYSENFFNFLETLERKVTTSILYLAFGDRYKINLLLNLRQDIINWHSTNQLVDDVEEDLNISEEHLQILSLPTHLNKDQLNNNELVQLLAVVSKRIDEFIELT